MAEKYGNLAAKNFAWKFAEQILAQSVNLIVSIVLARILLPQDYGVVTIVLIFIQVCDVFISQGFASALIQKKDVDNKDYSSMFYASFGLSIVLYIILYFSAPFFVSFFGSGYELSCPILRVMGLQIPISAFRSIQQAYVSRNLIFRNYFFSTLGGKISSAIVGIAMALEGFGAWSLAAQSLTNVIVDTTILYLTVRWKPILYFSYRRIKSMLSFGSKLVLAGLVDVLYAKLRGAVIAKNYSPSDLAYYEKGDQFPFLLMNNTNSSLMAVLYPILSKCQDDMTKLVGYCRKTVKICTYVIFPLMAWLALISEDLICYLMSDKWLPSVEYAKIFCAVYMFYPIYTVNLQAIKAVGKSGAFLILEITKKISGILCLLVSIPFGIYWIAMSLLISTIINYVINGVAAKVVLDYGYKNQIFDILPNVLMTVGIFFVCTLIPINTGYRMLNILMITQVLFGSYVIVSLLTKNESFMYLIDLIKNKFKK